MTRSDPHRAGEEPPRLVAHRGYARRYPENTLEALHAALTAGACFVEVDVQLSADTVPVLLHDAELRRTAGVDGRVFDRSYPELSALDANETDRLGSAFRGVRIPSLADAVELLSGWPRAAGFAEIKRESLDRFGVEVVLDRVLDVLRPRLPRWVVISFDVDAIRGARARGATIGWVLPEWSRETRRLAAELGPEYLFCNHEIIPAGEALWPGAWRWALYEVAEIETALRLVDRGAHLIETMAIEELLADPRLAEGSCK